MCLHMLDIGSDETVALLSPLLIWGAVEQIKPAASALSRCAIFGKTLERKNIKRRKTAIQNNNT